MTASYAEVPSAAPEPRRNPWHPHLDPLATAGVRLITRHLDEHALTCGVDDTVRLSRAQMHRGLDQAVDLAIGVWLATTPVSRGGLVLDREKPAA